MRNKQKIKIWNSP